MSRGSVRLLTFGSGRRELGFDVSLRGADKISTWTSGRRVLKPHRPSVLAGERLAATSRRLEGREEMTLEFSMVGRGERGGG